MTSVTSAPLLRSSSGQHFARDVGARKKKALALDVAQLSQRLHDRFGARLRRLEIDLESLPREALGRRRANRDELDALEIPDVAVARQQPPHEEVDAVRARENNPVVGAGFGDRLVERAVVVGRFHANHRRFDRLGAERFEQVDELARLLARSRDDDLLAEERPLVEPSQVLAQADHASDDENRRLRAQVLHLGELLQRAVGRALRRERAVVDDRRRLVRVEAVRERAR